MTEILSAVLNKGSGFELIMLGIDVWGRVVIATKVGHSAVLRNESTR